MSVGHCHRLARLAHGRLQTACCLYALPAKLKPSSAAIRAPLGAQLVRAAPCAHANLRPTAHLWPPALRPATLSFACIGHPLRLATMVGMTEMERQRAERVRANQEKLRVRHRRSPPLLNDLRAMLDVAGGRQGVQSAPVQLGLQTRCRSDGAPHLPIRRNCHDMGLGRDCAPSRGARRALERPALRRPTAGRWSSHPGLCWGMAAACALQASLLHPPRPA